MKHLGLFLLIFLVSLSFGFRLQNEYCSLLAKCDLGPPEKECPDSLKTGIPDIVYDDERCKEARVLVKNGVSIKNYQGQKLFGFLGQKYRVEYKVKDALPIPVAQFEYLLNDIPLAAKVVNIFQKTKYSAEYLDGDQRKYWRGSNGSNLTGEAYLIAGGVDIKHLSYFGFGVVSILTWKLKGDVLFDYKYEVTEGGPIKYDLKVLVFPGGAVINAIMNMGLFKKVVRNKILEVFEHIVHSAEELNKTNLEDILSKHKWTDLEKEKLKALMELRPN